MTSILAQNLKVVSSIYIGENNILSNDHLTTDRGLYLVPSQNVIGRPTVEKGFIVTAASEEGKLEFTQQSDILSLGDLTDVSLTDLENGDLLIYDSTSDLWLPGRSGIPGGVVTSVQYKKGNNFSGTNLFTYEEISRVLTVSNFVASNIKVGTSIFTNGILQNITILTGLDPPTGLTDAVNKAYVDGLVSNSPGGINTSVQFNDNTSFGGDSSFTYNTATNTLTIGVITGLLNPVGVTDAVNKQYADSLIASSPGGADTSIQFNDGGILGGNLTFVYNKITDTLNCTNIGVGDIVADTITTPIVSGLLNPVGVTDAVNKQYADSLIASSPGGADTSIQFNDGGILGGNGSFVYNKTTDRMTIGSIIGLSTPTALTQAANKEYVDNALGVSPGGTNQAVQFNNNNSFGGDPLFTYNTVTDTLNCTNIGGTAITDGTTIISGGNITNNISMESAKLIPQSIFCNNYHIVGSILDLPTQVGGVITLEDNITYLFTNNVDLVGNRIVCGTNQSILGIGSENTKLTSTGLNPSVALLTSFYSITFQKITLGDVGTLFNLDASGFSDQAIDWNFFNISNVPNIGLVKNYANAIVDTVAFFSSCNLYISGQTGTVAFVNSLFVGSSGFPIFSVRPDAVITRRLRFVFCSFVVFGTGVGIDIQPGAVLPTQGFILSDCNFSGSSATYLSGADETDAISDFSYNIGIVNSRSLGQIFMNGNAVATTITTAGDFVIIQGTTIESDVNKNFTSPSSMRLTYTGNISTVMSVRYSVSLNGNNGQNYEIGVFSSKSGGILVPSILVETAESPSKSVTISSSCFLQMKTGEYIELYVTNSSNTANCTIVNATMLVNII
jgi:hypothetical protein